MTTKKTSSKGSPPPKKKPTKVKAVKKARKEISADTIFLIALIGSFVIHNAILLYLYKRQIPKYESIEYIEYMPDRIVKLIAPKLVEEKKKKKELAASAATAAEETPTQEQTETPGEEGKPGPGQTNEEGTGGKGTTIDADKKRSREEIVKKVRTKGILKVITSRRGKGALVDVISGTSSFAGNLDEVIRKIAGVEHARSASEIKVARAPATGGGGVGIKELKATEGGAAGLGGKENVKVASRIKSATPQITGYLDVDAIKRIVKRRMALIKNCYEKQLKKDPNLHGKVVVEFTINAKGRVVRVSIKESTLNSEEVEKCIIMIFRRLRFPAPEQGEEVTVEYPLVFTIAS